MAVFGICAGDSDSVERWCGASVIRDAQSRYATGSPPYSFTVFVYYDSFHPLCLIQLESFSFYNTMGKVKKWKKACAELLRAQRVGRAVMGG